MKFPNKPKKSLGQNFLIDQNIIQKIIAIGNIKNNKTVLEIGSGYGHLTKKIANLKPKKIYAIEKDKNLAYLLKNDLTESKNPKKAPANESPAPVGSTTRSTWKDGTKNDSL